MFQSHNHPLIEVDQLTVLRSGKAVLEGISFQVNECECVAIVGPNGAGKTTLMLSMLGLLPIEQGQVLLRGKSLKRYGGRRAIARQIAYVPQQYEGFTGFTVADMVASGRYAHQGPLSLHTEKDLQIIDQAIAACGLGQLRDRVTSNLSGGERQKVFLAAAIAQQSPILFLDEPTTALDPKHQNELVSMLKHFQELGKTLVIICHDLNLAGALNARALALQSGELLFDEPIAEFISGDHLQQVFDTKFERLAAAGGNLRVLPSV